MLNELKDFGLTDGEARAYLSLLKLGSSTVGPIVKDSKISYSKIYEVLERLIEKGIVSYNIKEKTKYFQAVSPNRLLDFLDKKEEQIIKGKIKLKEIIPALEKIKNKKVKSVGEIFIGINGLRSAYEKLLEERDKKEDLLFFYLHNEKYGEAADLFYQQEFHYFKKVGIKLKGITNFDFRKSKFYMKTPSFVDLKFIDLPIPSMIDIYNGKVLLTMWRENPIGILIQSDEVYDNYKKYFKEVWNISRP